MRPPSNFGNDITNTQNNNSNNNNNNNNNNSGDRDESNNRSNQEYIISRLAENGATPVAHIAGKGIIKVVQRCEDAKENNSLDLSECQLIQVPDAVFHLMRHTELKTCDLSCNVITKIPPKIAVKFNFITDLNLSHNQMAKLPDELADLSALEFLDISHNSFLTLPSVVFKMRKLRKLVANTNKIIDIDTDEIVSSDSLELVDLKFNPLTSICYEMLRDAKVSFKIELSERQKEEWEDLTI